MKFKQLSNKISAFGFNESVMISELIEADGRTTSLELKLLPSNIGAPLVSFYPNPTNCLVRIESLELLQGIEVIDITGKLLLSEKVNTTSHVLQITNVNEGIYFVKLKFNDGRCITKKIVKQ